MNPAGAGNNTPQDENVAAESMVRYGERTIKTLTEEIARAEELLRQEIVKRNALLAVLCPPVRPDREPRQIKEYIGELEKEQMRLEEVIARQEADYILGLDPERDSMLHGGDGNRQNRIRARQNLIDLKVQLADCHTEMEKLRSLLSPIRTLPVEILRNIFDKCKKTEFYSDFSYPTLLSISHVCSFWRSLAIKDAYLWTCIEISLEKECSTSGLLSLIELWVDRSKNLPLTFSFLQQGTWTDAFPANPGFLPILNLLISQSHRWRKAAIQYDRLHSPGVRLFDGTASITTFPVLESMVVTCGAMDEIDIWKIMDTLCHSPRLQSVSWTVRSESLILTLPWAQLTYLCLIKLLRLEQILAILSAGVKLECAELVLCVMPNDPPVLQNHIIQKSLVHLKLDAGGDLAMLFDFLTMPNLAHLSLDEMHAPGSNMIPWQSTALLSFLQRSQCRLQDLSLFNLQLDSSGLLSILRYTSPTLMSLQLHPAHGSRCITDEVLLALTYPAPNPTSSQPDGDDGSDPVAILCPHLWDLHFSGPINTTDGLLAEVMKSRIFFRAHNLQRLVTGGVSMFAPIDRSIDAQVLTWLNSKCPKITFMVIPEA